MPAVQRSVSVVIPTRNRVPVLIETLRAAFAAAGTQGPAFEVLVVDDGDGGSLDVGSAFRERPLRIVRNRGRGAAAARNCGAASARHELLVFIDDDIILTPGTIERHIETHERYPQALVSGVVRPDERVIQEARRTAFGRYKLRFDYPLDNSGRVESLGDGVFGVDRVASFNLSVARADFFGRIGGFDERFPYAGCEDQEFSFRAHARGLRTLVNEGLICFHNEADRLSPEAWLRRQYTGVQGAVLLAHLYPEGKEHPIYRTFSSVSRRDSVPLQLRKVVVATFSVGSTPVILLKTLLVLERCRFPDPVLFKGFHLLWAIHTHRGFREGLRRLPELESPVSGPEVRGGSGSEGPAL